MHLRLKGTFIDVIDRDGGGKSPRARSEPRVGSRTQLEMEEEARYIAKLSSRIGYGIVGSRSELGDLTPRRQTPLVPRQSLRDVGQEQEQRLPAQHSMAVSSKARPAAPTHDVPRLHHLRGESQRENSPCSWQGDAGSDRESLVDSQPSSGGRGDPKGAVVRKRDVFERVFDERSRSNADEVIRWWVGPESEPGGAAVCWRDKRALREAVRRTSNVGERHLEPLEAAAAPTAAPSPTASTGGSSHDVCKDFLLLSQVVGKWRVLDGSQQGGSWVVEDGGRAFFNGKRFGTDYDIFESNVATVDGATVRCLLRNDGWSASLDADDQDKLVWRKAGEREEITWLRAHPKPKDPADEGGEHRKGRKFETKTQLSSKMQAKAQQMSSSWRSEDRLSSAMAAMEEIPRRISEDMQRAASYMVDNMQSEVAAMSKTIRGTDAKMREEREARGRTSKASNDKERSTEKVIKNLEVIPTMVQNLLLARVEKAKFKVRNRVQGMMENLSAIKEEDWQDHEELVTQMRLITEEVEQIAGEAVRAAAQECHAHATKQLDCALSALRDANDREDGSETPPEGEEPVTEAGAAVPKRAKWADIMDSLAAGAGSGDCPGWLTHDPELWSKRESESLAKETIEQAVAVVQDKNHIPQSFTNQVVADELLRARIRSGGGQRRGHGNASAAQSSRGGHDSLRGSTHRGTPRRGDPWVKEDRQEPPQSPAVPAAATITNPGSAGHPDLCLRPCLYFAQGNCTNGNECAFCHLPHPKRPVRFDKLHRESLKKMPFSQFLSIMLPVLKQKARDLDFSRDIRDLLDTLWPPLDAQVLSGIPDEEEAPSAPIQETSPWIFAATSRRSETNFSAVSSNASATGSDRSCRRSSFGGALQAMGFRCLLSMLLSKAPEEQLEVRALLEEVLKSLHNTAVASTPLGPGSSRSEAGFFAPAILEPLPEGGTAKEGPPEQARVGWQQQSTARRRPRNDIMFRNWSGPATETGGRSSRYHRRF